MASKSFTSFRSFSGRSSWRYQVSYWSQVVSVLAIQKGLISISRGVSFPSGEKTNFPPGMGIISNLTRVPLTRSVKGEKPTGPEVGGFDSAARARLIELRRIATRMLQARFIIPPGQRESRRRVHRRATICWEESCRHSFATPSRKARGCRNEVRRLLIDATHRRGTPFSRQR